jgi:hypothetical protein
MGLDPVSLALGGLQSAYGISQMIKGNKMAKSNQRPDYQIPQEIQANMNDAQRMALEGLPTEQKQQYINNIQRSQQFGLSAMSDRKGGLAGLSDLTQTANDSYNNMLSQDAAARQGNQRQLMAQRGEMAGYKDKAFELNKLNPFYEKAKAAAALKGAGNQNLWGGIGTVAGGLGDIFKGKAKDDTTLKDDTVNSLGATPGNGMPNWKDNNFFNPNQGQTQYNMYGTNYPATSK